MYVCASLNERAKLETRICSAVAISAMGIAAISTPKSTGAPRSRLKPRSRTGVYSSTNTQHINVRITQPSANTTAASTCPARWRAWDRVEQQRLERASLALAGGRVDGQLHASDEGRHQHEHRHEREHARGQLLRASDFDLGDGQRMHDLWIDAARDQPATGDVVAVVAEQLLYVRDAGAAVVARAIDDSTRPWPTCRVRSCR